MTDEAPAIKTGFVRQRRNLLVTTLVLVAFQKTGASIDTLNVFGNTIGLAQPLALAIPLWLAWGYFLIRYYQYFHDIGDRGLASAYLMRLVELGKRQAVKELKRTFKPDHEGLEKPEPPDFHANLVELAATPPEWVFQVTGTMTTRQRKPTYKSWQDIFRAHKVHVPAGRMLLPRIRAAWWVAAHTRFATEYVLPFVVASVPVIIQIAEWV